MKSNAWSFIAGAAIAACTISCTFLVDMSTDYAQDTCTFAGETTTDCGKCIASSCEKLVVACCGDPICAGNLGSLDTCGATGTCAELFQDTDGGGEDGGARGSLNTCITTSCAASCTNASADGGGDSATPVTSGVSCSNASDGNSCTCVDPASSTTSGSCSPKSLGTSSSVCCGPPGWETTGSCTCYKYLCLVDNGGQPGCDCSFGGHGDDPDGTYEPSEGCEQPSVDDPGTQTSGCCLSSDGLHCFCTVFGNGESCDTGYQSTESCTRGSACPNDLTSFSSCN